MTCDNAAQVAVDIRVRQVDRVFDYAVPPALADKLKPGHRVLVPFGHRFVEGYVVRYPVASEQEQLKPIKELLDAEPLITASGLQLAGWLRERYLCYLSQSLQCWLPPGTSMRSSSKAAPLYKNVYQLKEGLTAEQIAVELARAPKQKEAALCLLSRGGTLSGKEAGGLGIKPAVLEALVARGLADCRRLLVKRDPWRGRLWEKSQWQLTPAQQAVAARLVSAVRSGRGEFLLKGVTGSGKTVIYLETIAAALEAGKSAIVLVPEISLTPQAVHAFKSRFGDQVAVLHSRLSTSERADQWRAAYEGEVRVVLGARSAVFAPLSDLGLIVIDEEHESAYKQEEAPRYHAREVALERVRRCGGVLLLGSATPSLESYRKVQEGALELLELPERVDGKPLPKVELVDMREELMAGNRTMFSRELYAALHDCLVRGEQAILFLNRRGFATFLLCRQCGHSIGCDHCQVTMTFHQPDRLICHYCHAEKKVPGACPSCQSNMLRPFGAGTQKVEAETRRLFPRARIMRMDMDTTSRKGAHEQIWQAFRNGEADILIGTQMVAKGLHFPGVTLVGVLCADVSLHLPDFRAAERTFQLLTQVAGRAGRGSESGRVLVQTYIPEHYSIQAAQAHDYDGFARQELFYRQKAGYPPFTSLLRVIVSALEEAEAAGLAKELARYCYCPGVKVVGPAPAPLSRLKDHYRWHILLKGEAELLAATARNALSQVHAGSVQVGVDVDPLSLL